MLFSWLLSVGSWRVVFGLLQGGHAAFGFNEVAHELTFIVVLVVHPKMLVIELGEQAKGGYIVHIARSLRLQRLPAEIK